MISLTTEEGRKVLAQTIFGSLYNFLNKDYIEMYSNKKIIVEKRYIRISIYKNNI